ncbi:MAG: hypothetical protein QNJ90_03355 [Planctomycetota bacterium]|nr:hypothetical protein [Planctomycetota bacterium]
MSNSHPIRSTVERGVAMLIVITILVSMVLVAVPFALSMRQGQERTQANIARGRAKYEADLLADLVKLFLVKGHPHQEQMRYDRGERSADALPFVDTLEELTPDDSFRKTIEAEIIAQWEKDPAKAERARYLKSRGLGPMNDDRGSIWTVLVQDAQALVNVNGGSPFLLANLMGSAILADDLDTGGGDISVEHVVTGRFGGLRGFPRDGGYIRIGREVIKYEEFDGQAFKGCERGMLQEVPLRDNGNADSHEKGVPVIDYTAYKLATHMIARRPGQLSPFENLEALRDIASWGEDGVLKAERLERLLPHLTVWSGREGSGSWLADQLVMNELPVSVEGEDPDEVQLRDFRNNPSGTTHYLNAGTLVRVTDGIEGVYGMVDKIGDGAGRRRGMYATLAGRVNATNEDLQFKGGETKIAAFAPYPININTASRTVLYAVMANVQLWRAEGKEQVVTPELAWSLAGEIVRARKGAVQSDKETGRRESGPFRHAEDFGRWLEDKVKASEITRAQHAALYMNAINPNSSQLRFGTAPWCFRTLDVYHIEARVALNNRAGEQIAEASVREVVEIGSDTTATWTLDSQDEFERPLAMGSGGKWITTYPFGVGTKLRPGAHHVQPAMRGPKSIINHVYPSDTRGEDIGDVRLEPARLLLPGAQVENHFDTNWYTDGWYTGFDGAYTRRTKGTLMGRTDTKVRPFSMSFWWRPYSDANWTAFDAGKEQFMNRFALFVQEGDEGQELTFRCCAGTMWKAGADVYVPLEQLDYEPGNWYHIHVSCRGEDPSTMQLLVDGVDVGKRRGLTALSGSVVADANDVPVESTDGFPVRGAIRIGTEIIEYDSRSDGAFRDCIRGARGTQAQEWPANTPVHNVGYSMPLKTDIMTGGRRLQESLRKWTAVRVSTVQGQPATDELPYNDFVTFRGFGPDTRSITVSTVGIWGQNISESQEAFNTKGLALLGCPAPGDPNAGGGGGSGGPAGPGPQDEPPAQEDDSGGNHTNPGGGVPPGRELPDSGGSDGGTPDVPGPGDSGGGDTGGGTGGTQAGADVKWGGWEVVYYERSGSEFTIQRYQQTAWQGEASPYFLITEIVQGNAEWPAYLVPISVMGTGQGTPGDDYLDPSDEQHREILTRHGDEQWPAGQQARVFLGTDTPEDAYEIIKYDSIERNLASPDILFVRDRSLSSITAGFFNQPRGIPGGTANPPDDTDPPVPPDTDPPVPPDPNPDPGDFPPPPGDGGDPDEPQDPTPGGGVPPGLRDPQDPPGTDPGDPTDPGGGDPGTDPGTDPGEPGDGPTPSPGPGGDVDGGDEGEEPTGEDPLDDGSGEFEPPPEQDDGSEEEGGDATPGGGVEPGARPGGEEGDGSGDTGGDPPPEEEPAPDDSGGGGDFGEDGEEEGGDAKIPNVPAPGAREPTDPEEEPADDGEGDAGEPLDPYQGDDDLYEYSEAARDMDFRGTYTGGQQADGGVDHLGGAGTSDENSKYLPCFRVWETHRLRPISRVGLYDVLTLTEGGEDPVRQEMGVRWGDPTSEWVALDDWIETRVRAPEEGEVVRRNDQRGYARVLKFPSGELPDEMSEDIEWGQSSLAGSGLVTAFLDELFVWRQGLDTTIVINNTEGLLETDDEIRLANVLTDQDLMSLDGYDEDCGLVLVEGELIVYRGSRMEGEDTLILERCARGQLGTKPRFHPIGVEVRFLPDLPVSYLEAGMTSDAASISLARTRGWPREGLARVVREDTAELMHYTRLAEGEALMPKSLDADERTRDRGLFRGRFGTDATDHDTDEIVFFQPFRYWDRYTPRRGEDEDSFGGIHDHPESSFLEIGTRARSGLWRGFTWSENLMGRLSGGTIGSEDGSTADSGFLDIVVVARFNPNVSWETNNVVDLRSEAGFGQKPDLSRQLNSHLFVFDDIGDATIGGRMKGNRLDVEADTAEFRVYFMYKPNAFESVDAARQGSGFTDDPILSNTWKQTPWLRSFSVNYFSRTEVRHRAAVR